MSDGDRRRWRGPLAIALVVALVAVGATVANVALLSSAGEDDRLGRLRPTTPGFVAPAGDAAGTTTSRTATTPTGASTATTIPPPGVAGDDDDGGEGDDSGHGRGRNRGRGGGDDD